jgi:hypothetical protein
MKLSTYLHVEPVNIRVVSSFPHLHGMMLNTELPASAHSHHFHSVLVVATVHCASDSSMCTMWQQEENCILSQRTSAVWTLWTWSGQTPHSTVRALIMHYPQSSEPSLYHPSCSSKIQFNVMLQSVFPVAFFPSSIPTETLYASIFSPVPAVYPTYLILFHFSIVIHVFCRQCKLR